MSGRKESFVVKALDLREIGSTLASLGVFLLNLFTLRKITQTEIVQVTRQNLLWSETCQQFSSM